jgi:hypothetical protein
MVGKEKIAGVAGQCFTWNNWPMEKLLFHVEHFSQIKTCPQIRSRHPA